MQHSAKDASAFPLQVPPSEKIVSDTYNCSLGPPWVNVSLAKMYKNEKKLLYPVNVGRNVARESAPTFYVFASDIELYPSPNLPVEFLEMIRKRDQPALYKPNPKVFVLSIFEVDEKNRPPNNKTHLVCLISVVRLNCESRMITVIINSTVAIKHA